LTHTTPYLFLSRMFFFCLTSSVTIILGSWIRILIKMKRWKEALESHFVACEGPNSGKKWVVGSGSASKWKQDPASDPHQHDADPQLCLQESFRSVPPDRFNFAEPVPPSSFSNNIRQYRLYYFLSQQACFSIARAGRVLRRSLWLDGQPWSPCITASQQTVNACPHGTKHCLYKSFLKRPVAWMVEAPDYTVLVCPQSALLVIFIWF